jgi:O-antigen ligase
MKYSTTLKQSKGSVRFLFVTVPIAWGLFIWLRWWQLAAIAGFISFYLVMDLLNIRRIAKAAAKDPDYLKKKIPGT